MFFSWLNIQAGRENGPDRIHSFKPKDGKPVECQRFRIKRQKVYAKLIKVFVRYLIGMSMPVPNFQISSTRCESHDDPSLLSGSRRRSAPLWRFGQRARRCQVAAEEG